MASRTCVPCPSTLRVTCRWPFQIWDNSTRVLYHVTLSHDLQQHSATASHKFAERFSLISLSVRSQIIPIICLWFQLRPGMESKKSPKSLIWQKFEKKDTAPGIPRRSPIQVLTRPAVVTHWLYIAHAFEIEQDRLHSTEYGRIRHSIISHHFRPSSFLKLPALL